MKFRWKWNKGHFAIFIFAGGLWMLSHSLCKTGSAPAERLTVYFDGRPSKRQVTTIGTYDKKWKKRVDVFFVVVVFPLALWMFIKSGTSEKWIKFWSEDEKDDSSN